MHSALPLCPGSVPVVGTVCNTVSGLAGSAAGAGVDAVFSAAGTWVSTGAVWLIGEMGQVLSSTTTVDLSSGWFRAHEAVMTGIAAAVVVPMVCCAAIQAVYRQSPSALARSFLVYLPLSLLLTGVAVALVRIALVVTDALSSQVMSGAGVDTSNLFSGLSAYLSGGPAGPAAPAFVAFLAGLLVALAALVLWLELVVRAAAVSAAVLFLPLALAALVWPAVAHWCRRLADTLAALVLSKLVVAAVLSLGVGALAGGLGFSGKGPGGGFSAVVTGIALLAIAALAPFTLLRLVPAVEAGAAAHLESVRHRVQSGARAPVRSGGSLALDMVRRGDRGSEGDASQVGTVAASGGAGTTSGLSAANAMVTGGDNMGGQLIGKFRKAEDGPGAAPGTAAGVQPGTPAGVQLGTAASAAPGVSPSGRSHADRSSTGDASPHHHGVEGRGGLGPGRAGLDGTGGGDG